MKKSCATAANAATADRPVCTCVAIASVGNCCAPRLDEREAQFEVPAALRTFLALEFDQRDVQPPKRRMHQFTIGAVTVAGLLADADHRRALRDHVTAAGGTQIGGILKQKTAQADAPSCASEVFDPYLIAVRIFMRDIAPPDLERRTCHAERHAPP
ncbi:hypothetical protein OKW27_004500 [Paraburkholderia sp. 35.1]